MGASVKVKQRLQKQRVYGGIVGTLAAARLLMPLAARAFQAREIPYEYDDQEGRGLFVGSQGETIYCPENAKCYPMGGGQAVLEVQGEDNTHEWFVAGIPALDNCTDGQIFSAGQALGVAEEDLLIGLDMRPMNSSGEIITADPLKALQDGKADFVDAGAAAGAPNTDIVPASSTVPAVVKVDPSTLGEGFLSKKPLFTPVHMATAIVISMSLTGLVVWGLTRRPRYR